MATPLGLIEVSLTAFERAVSRAALSGEYATSAEEEDLAQAQLEAARKNLLELLDLYVKEE